MTEDEIIGWHHRLDGHEFEQALGDSEGQGSLPSCSPCGHKESDTPERPNNMTIRPSLKMDLRGACSVGHKDFLCFLSKEKLLVL